MAITFKNPLTIVQQAGGEPDSYGTVKYTENGVDKTVEMATEDECLSFF